MLNEDQKNHVVNQIKEFKNTISDYSKIKENLLKIEMNLKNKNDELLKVSKEERIMDDAIEVLYGQTKKSSLSKIIESEIINIKNTLEYNSTELEKIKNNLLIQLDNLPIPINLEKISAENSNMIFSYFENANLGELEIDIISELIGKEKPIRFNDVYIMPNKIVVPNTSNKNEAILKIIEAIKVFRIYVDDFLKFYKEIDGMLERILNSSHYKIILNALYNKGRLSSEDIGILLGIDTQKAYHACYNLTRRNWSPSPIQKLPSGEWELTITGKILMDRYIEKYQKNKSNFNLNDVEKRG